MKALEVMTDDNIHTVRDDQSCEDAVRLMWNHDIGSVPVLSSTSGTVIGMVTDRDVCMCAYTKGQRLADLPVRFAMSRTLIAANPDDDIKDVEQLMQQHQIRRIPVVDGDQRIRGIVAFADIARLRSASSKNGGVSEREIATTIHAVSQPHPQ